MIGVDIVDVARFRDMKDAEAFFARVFTDAEKRYLAEKRNAPTSAAGLFAAKEAVAKALGTGFSDGVTLKDIEILHDKLGQPVVKLYGKAESILAQDIMDGTKMYVSISHSDAEAVAVAMIR